MVAHVTSSRWTYLDGGSCWLSHDGRAIRGFAVSEAVA
jgi:hypothetical protein